MSGARPVPAGPRGFGPFPGEVKLFCARCGASGMAQLVGEACGNCPACDGPLQRRPPMATTHPMLAASRGFGSYRAAPPVDPVQWALIDPSLIANTSSPRHVQSVLEDAQQTIAELLQALEASASHMEALMAHLEEKPERFQQHCWQQALKARAAISKATGAA